MIEILNGVVETVSYNEVQGVRVHHNTEAENYPFHWHTAIEVILPLKNGYVVEIEKEKHEINVGDIFIIAPGQLHTLYAPADGERLIVLIDHSLVCSLKGMQSLVQLLYPYRIISSAGDSVLYNKLSGYMLEVEKEYFKEEKLFEANIYSLIIKFFVELGRSSLASEGCSFNNISQSKQHEYINKFLNVCNYINDHYAEDIDADTLAGIAGFSRFHFSRLFKQYTGSTYYEYLTKKRIEMAERYLISPELSITEVAMRSGFNSLSTFNRVFKSALGCTPSEYKGLNRGF